ncbi:penicillin-binding protein 2 [Motilibacter rhizosphaerae]|uniref:Penicillin-binding protein 2 n=1 Tax=Motilibacter rhizosphaerae TaxID=598652 RepID=A0A4Q7NRS5_9ACTN|nr:penicillin-binding protein 2 [Motilibacter rhizosphaerae]RZS89786.1 penicillin-binding protein 2 [Motilibacter rhizosphaerae]
MSERSTVRLLVLMVLVVSLLGTLGGRLWYLQVRTGSSFAQAATSNRVREIVTPATRGLILDAQGRRLAQNTTALVVSVSRTELLKQPHGGVALLTRLAKVLGTTEQELHQRTTLCSEPGRVKGVCWNGSPYEPIPVSDIGALSQQQQMLIAQRINERQEDFPGVTAEQTAVRDYPGAGVGANAAQLLGYLGPVTQDEIDKAKAAGQQLEGGDLVGRSGLEKEYDSYLRGVPGVEQLAVDHRGGVTGTIAETDPTPGDYLVTTIDAKVQKAAEDALRGAITHARTVGDPNKAFKKYKADSGAVVVLDTQTGGVVAMASYPSYDPNVWVNGISSKEYAAITGAGANYPVLNRAIQGDYAAGSIFKAISTAGAVKAGYSTSSSVDCPSSYPVGGKPKKNYESEAYGRISFERAIEVSCDTNWYAFAQHTWDRLGGYSQKSDAKDPFVQAAKGYGLGEQTGIDLPGEHGGRIPTREWKRAYWEQTKASSCLRAKKGYPELSGDRARFLLQLAKENCTDGWRYGPGDEANFVIGQGDVLVTPLQMARVYAAVANGGTMWEPHVAKAVMSPAGRVIKQFRPVSAGKLPASKGTIDFLHTALHGVTVKGTAAGVFRGWPNDALPMAAKTGTAEVYGKQSTSWFASFGPVSNPRYAVVMMVSQGGTGSGTSGPAVRKIYEALLGVKGTTVDPATAVPPGAQQPKALPRVAPDGRILAPQGRKPTAVVRPRKSSGKKGA